MLFYVETHVTSSKATKLFELTIYEIQPIFDCKSEEPCLKKYKLDKICVIILTTKQGHESVLNTWYSKKYEQCNNKFPEWYLNTIIN